MTRVLSAIALGAVALTAILLLPPAGVRILACLVAALTAHEYLRIVHAHRPLPGAAPWILLVAVTCWSTVMPGQYDLLWLMFVCFGGVAIEVLFRKLTLEDAGMRFFAPWYIGMPLGLLSAIHVAHGWRATILLISTVVVSDSAQYYSGRAFGRRPLAPVISPKKTIEGAIGGVIVGTLYMLFAGPLFLPATAPLPLALTGLAIVVVGICGDLFESRLKRVAGVKDSSTLIPGHGGILDRIDALLFATPVFFLYLRTLA